MDSSCRKSSALRVSYGAGAERVMGLAQGLSSGSSAALGLSSACVTLEWYILKAIQITNSVLCKHIYMIVVLLLLVVAVVVSLRLYAGTCCGLFGR